MAPLPIQAIVRGDFVAQLVLIDTDDSVDAMIEKINHHAVGRRVSGESRKWNLFCEDEQIEDGQTAGSAGIQPLDVVEVVPVG